MLLKLHIWYLSSRKSDSQWDNFTRPSGVCKNEKITPPFFSWLYEKRQKLQFLTIKSSTLSNLCLIDLTRWRESEKNKALSFGRKDARSSQSCCDAPCWLFLFFFGLRHFRLKCLRQMFLYSIQPKVSIRVDGAIELGTKISQPEAAAANVRLMPKPAGTQVCRWLAALRLNSVAPSTRIETFGWTDHTHLILYGRSLAVQALQRVHLIAKRTNRFVFAMSHPARRRLTPAVVTRSPAGLCVFDLYFNSYNF